MGNILSTYISTDELVIIVVFLLVVILVLLILLYLNNRRLHRIAYPIYDYIIKGAEVKAQKITHDAMKESRGMLREAELEGIKVVAKERLESQKVEEEYAKRLDELAKQAETLLGRYTQEIGEDLKRLSGGLEKRVADSIAKNETFLQEETDKLSNQLGTMFTTLEANAKEQIRHNVEKELISVKKLVETYRQERFALIDDQIISLIENTASIALQKTLSLSDHTELIYRALEDAKAKGILK